MVRTYHKHRVTLKTIYPYWHYLRITHRSNFGKEEHKKEILTYNQDMKDYHKAKKEVKKEGGKIRKYRDKMIIYGSLTSLISLLTIISLIPNVQVEGLVDVYCAETCEIPFSICTSKYDLDFRGDQIQPFYFEGNATLERIINNKNKENFSFNNNYLKKGECWNLTAIVRKNEFETIKYGFEMGEINIDPYLYSEVISAGRVDRDLGNGKRNLILYSGTHFGFEDNKWKPIKELKNFRYSTNIKCLVNWETESDVRGACDSWNHTHVKVMLLNMKGRKKTNYPVKIIKKEFNKTLNKTVEKIIRKENLQFEKDWDWKEITIKADFGDTIKIGENSTTIQLQDADTENLEDTYIYSTSGDSNYGGLTYISCEHPGIFSMIKFNISGIPSGQQIDNATFYANSYYEDLDGGEAINIHVMHIYSYPTYNISDLEWVETSATWNERPVSGEYNETYEDNVVFSNGDSGWFGWTVTNMVRKTYLDEDKNISIYLNTTISSGSPNFEGGTFCSKEYTNTTLRPYLNITYSEAGDSTNPTSNSPSDASYTQNSAQTIGWILQDETGAGNYTVYRNGTIQNSSTAWTNNTNLNVWVNTTTVGNNWNYTIYFNDSAGNDGTPDTVFINVTTPSDTCTYTSGNWAINCSDNCSFVSTDVGGNNVTITGSGGTAKWIQNITNYTSFVISGGCTCFAKDG